MTKKKNKNRKFLRNIIFVVAFVIIALVSLIYYLNISSAKYKNVTFYQQSLSDFEYKLYVSDWNVIYELNSNSKPEKLDNFTRIISGLKLFESGDLVIYADGRYVSESGKRPKGLAFEDEPDKGNNMWLLKDGRNEPEVLKNLSSVPGIKAEKHYITQEDGRGGANILLSGNPNVIGYDLVGHLSHKVDRLSWCDSGGSETFYPYDFTPSFNGDFLLGNTRGGGGVCFYTRHVFTRDGKYNFEIDTNDAGNGIWIGNNKFLIFRDSNSKPEIVTYENNGTSTTQTLEIDFKGYRIDKESLSPSKKYLLLRNNKLAAIYDIENNILTEIKSFVQTSRWAIKTEKVLLFNEYLSNGDRMISVSIYDIVSGKIQKIASYPLGTDLRGDGIHFELL